MRPITDFRQKKMQTIDHAITSFLLHCQFEKNLSEKTRACYLTDLKQFTTFLLSNNYPNDLLLVDKTQIKHYLKDLSNWKVKTIKRKIATLKAMFNYLEYEDLVPSNPVRKLRIKLKEPQLLPRTLTKEEVLAMLHETYRQLSAAPKYSYTYFEKLRSTVVIELLFSSGARVSEIADLKLKNVDLESGNLLLEGKGSKERHIQLCNSGTLTLLQSYTDTCAQRFPSQNQYLLLNRLGRKLSDQSIRNQVESLAKATSTKGKVTPHTFRHTFATLLLENDVDIKYIQRMLGHASISTTQLYTRVNSVKQKQLLKDKHPRMAFKIELIASE